MVPALRPLITAEVTVAKAPLMAGVYPEPELISIKYPTIGYPPELVGAAHVRFSALAVVAVITSAVGAPDTCAGVSDVTAVALPEPVVTVVTRK